MPVYEWYCAACRFPFEKFHKTMTVSKPACPECGKKGKVKRAVAGYSFIKDEVTKMAEMHPKYAQMVDAAWEKSSRNDPMSKGPFRRATDSGIRVQDLD
jgi:putative FmdB family regulatory protein